MASESPSNPTVPSLERGLFLAAAAAIVVAAMKWAAAVVVPVLLASFVTVLLTPALHGLERRRVPTALAVALLMLGLLAATVLVGGLVGQSLRSFDDNLPRYQAALSERTSGIEAWLAERGVEPDFAGLLERLSPHAALRLTGGFVAVVSGLLGNAMLILFVIVFMLLEASILPAKLRASLSAEDWRSVEEVARDVRRYMGLKTLISAATGVLVSVLLAIYGVDAAILLGLIAFALNFIPNIGSIVAAVPGVLLALIQLGLFDALVVAAGYLVINTVIGNLLEPRILGVGLGLSPLVVMLSLIFWGWILGLVGALLAIPLTMSMVIVLERHPETRRYAQLLTLSAAEPASDSPGR